MGRQVKSENVRESRGILPKGITLFSIEELSEEMSKGEDGKKPKAMKRGVFRVANHATHSDYPIYENFVLGTDKDPFAQDSSEYEKTVGMGRLQSLLKAVKLAQTPNYDVDAECQQAVQRRFYGLVDHSKEADVKRDGTPNPYAGKVRADIVRFFSIEEGEKAAVPSQATTGLAITAPVASAPDTIKCGACNSLVAKADFVKHAQAHAA